MSTEVIRGVSSREDRQFFYTRRALNDAVRRVDEVARIPRQQGESEEDYLNRSYLLCSVRERIRLTPPGAAAVSEVRPVEVDYARERCSRFLRDFWKE